LDLGDALGWYAVQAHWPRTAIQQRDLAAVPPAPHPFAHLLADAEVGRHFNDPFTGTDVVRHQQSTARGVVPGARIIVDVYPGPRLRLLMLGNQQSPKPASDERPGANHS
jgi:hypothetical protein